jgi:hypothetical protein
MLGEDRCRSNHEVHRISANLLQAHCELRWRQGTHDAHCAVATINKPGHWAGQSDRSPFPKPSMKAGAEIHTRRKSVWSVTGSRPSMLPKAGRVRLVESPTQGGKLRQDAVCDFATEDRTIRLQQMPTQ